MSDEAYKRTLSKVENIPDGFIHFKDGLVGHTFENELGYKMLKINHNRTNGRRLSECDSNAILLYREHFGVIGDNALVKDLGVIEDDIKLWASKIENLSEEEKEEYGIKD